MNDDVYTKLREFLDTLPAGFPATPTGVEIKLLKKMYTPEQAELTTKLKEEPEEVADIARRTGLDEANLAEKLEEMAQNGLIFRVRDGDKKLYQAYQFIVGTYEFQLKNLDKEFSELFEEYLPYIGLSMVNVKTSQMRVVPVESSVGVDSEVATYNRVRELVKQQDLISVAQCICRKEQELLGNGCSYPGEVCMGFGEFAQYYLDNGMAKQLTTEEALKTLDHAEEAGLVLMPTNSQKVEAICCCCSCCCPSLKFAKIAPRPSDFVKSYYEAAIDPELCTACGTCAEMCQMDAINEGDDVSDIIDGRCIGCGICVSSCPTEAISLVKKADIPEPPAGWRDTIAKIKSERTSI